MKLVNLVWILVFAAAALCTPVSASFAQEEEEELLVTVPVLQGGFGYVDKRKKSEDFALSDMTMYSNGPTFLSGGRVRQIAAGGCTDVIWSMNGMSKTDRTDKRLKAKQSDFAAITFAFFICEDDVPVCLIGASPSVEISGCQATTKTNAKQTLKKGLPPVGQSKFECKNGIDIFDPRFELPEPTTANILNEFPDIRNKFRAKFSDDAGLILEPGEALDLLSPGLGLDSCF